MSHAGFSLNSHQSASRKMPSYRDDGSRSVPTDADFRSTAATAAIGPRPLDWYVNSVLLLVAPTIAARIMASDPEGISDGDDDGGYHHSMASSAHPPRDTSPSSRLAASPFATALRLAVRQSSVLESFEQLNGSIAAVAFAVHGAKLAMENATGGRDGVPAVSDEDDSRSETSSRWGAASESEAGRSALDDLSSDAPSGAQRIGEGSSVVDILPAALFASLAAAESTPPPKGTVGTVGGRMVVVPQRLPSADDFRIVVLSRRNPEADRHRLLTRENIARYCTLSVVHDASQMSWMAVFCTHVAGPITAARLATCYPSHGDQAAPLSTAWAHRDAGGGSLESNAAPIVDTDVYLSADTQLAAVGRAVTGGLKHAAVALRDAPVIAVPAMFARWGVLLGGEPDSVAPAAHDAEKTLPVSSRLPPGLVRFAATQRPATIQAIQVALDGIIVEVDKLLAAGAAAGGGGGDALDQYVRTGSHHGHIAANPIDAEHRRWCNYEARLASMEEQCRAPMIRAMVAVLHCFQHGAGAPPPLGGRLSSVTSAATGGARSHSALEQWDSLVTGRLRSAIVACVDTQRFLQLLVDQTQPLFSSSSHDDPATVPHSRGGVGSRATSKPPGCSRFILDTVSHGGEGGDDHWSNATRWLPSIVSHVKAAISQALRTVFLVFKLSATYGTADRVAMLLIVVGDRVIELCKLLLSRPAPLLMSHDLHAKSGDGHGGRGGDRSGAHHPLSPDSHPATLTTTPVVAKAKINAARELLEFYVASFHEHRRLCDAHSSALGATDEGDSVEPSSLVVPGATPKRPNSARPTSLGTASPRPGTTITPSSPMPPVSRTRFTPPPSPATASHGSALSAGAVLGRLDLILVRLQRLETVVDVLDQFDRLRPCRQSIDGLVEILSDFDTQADLLQHQGGDYLDARSQEFDHALADFNGAVGQLSVRLANSISNVATPADSAVPAGPGSDDAGPVRGRPQAVRALRMFADLRRALKHNESLSSVLDSNLSAVITAFGRELDSVRALYESQKTCFPAQRNTPPVAAAACWSRQLLRRIEEPMTLIQREGAHLLLRDTAARRVVKLYNTIATTLVAFEQQYVQAWCAAVNVTRSGLSATLLVFDKPSATSDRRGVSAAAGPSPPPSVPHRSGSSRRQGSGSQSSVSNRDASSPPTHQLFVNFDPQVMELLAEAVWLRRLGGIIIPENVQQLLRKRSQLLHYVEELRDICRLYAELLDRVEPQLCHLFIAPVQRANVSLNPLLTTITWLSVQVPDAINRARISVSRELDLVKRLHAQYDQRVKHSIVAIGGAQWLPAAIATLSTGAEWNPPPAAAQNNADATDAAQVSPLAALDGFVVPRYRTLPEMVRDTTVHARATAARINALSTEVAAGLHAMLSDLRESYYEATGARETHIHGWPRGAQEAAHPTLAVLRQRAVEVFAAHEHQVHDAVSHSLNHSIATLRRIFGLSATGKPSAEGQLFPVLPPLLVMHVILRPTDGGGGATVQVHPSAYDVQSAMNAVARRIVLSTRLIYLWSSRGRTSAVDCLDVAAEQQRLLRQQYERRMAIRAERDARSDVTLRTLHCQPEGTVAGGRSGAGEDDVPDLDFLGVTGEDHGGFHTESQPMTSSHGWGADDDELLESIEHFNDDDADVIAATPPANNNHQQAPHDSKRNTPSRAISAAPSTQLVACGPRSVYPVVGKQRLLAKSLLQLLALRATLQRHYDFVIQNHPVADLDLGALFTGADKASAVLEFAQRQPPPSPEEYEERMKAMRKCVLDMEDVARGGTTTSPFASASSASGGGGSHPAQLFPILDGVALVSFTKLTSSVRQEAADWIECLGHELCSAAQRCLSAVVHRLEDCRGRVSRPLVSLADVVTATSALKTTRSYEGECDEHMRFISAAHDLLQRMALPIPKEDLELSDAATAARAALVTKCNETQETLFRSLGTFREMLRGESLSLLSTVQILFTDYRASGLIQGTAIVGGHGVASTGTSSPPPPTATAARSVTTVPSATSAASSSSSSLRLSVSPRLANERLQHFQRQIDEAVRKLQHLNVVATLFGTDVAALMGDVRSIIGAVDDAGALSSPLLAATSSRTLTTNGGAQPPSGNVAALGPFSRLFVLQREASLLSQLFTFYQDVAMTVQHVGEQVWFEADFQSVEQATHGFVERCAALPRALRDFPAYQDVKRVVDNLSFSVPYLSRLRDRSVRPRHWDALCRICNATIDPKSPDLRLKQMLDIRLADHVAELEELLTSASKEADIEIKLSRVADEFAARPIFLAPYKNRGLLLLRSDSTAQLLQDLEDAQAQLSTLSSNRHNEFFRRDIAQWAKKLANTQAKIEDWLSVQHAWAHIEAIFNDTQDIAKEMPSEVKRFTMIDRLWVRIMQAAAAQCCSPPPVGLQTAPPSIVRFCAPGELLSNTLPHMASYVELCQKSLAGYMTSKRASFPRFFFLSDAQLLDILGRGADPRNIVPHLLSVTSNVLSLTFNAASQATEWQSTEGESVRFVSPLNAQPGTDIVTWLTRLIDALRRTMRTITVRLQDDVVKRFGQWSTGSVGDAALSLSSPAAAASDGQGGGGSPREILQFINAFPGQLSLLGFQLLWTADGESLLLGIRSQDKQALSNRVLRRGKSLLDAMVALSKDSGLSSLNRTRLETIITIQVHQLDCIVALVRAGKRLSGPTDFDWLRHLRCVWRGDKAEVVVGVADTELPYGYEYIGSVERLVVTSLTDRIYISCLQAMSMGFGGAPTGPAGTGKTETTRDLGRACGRYFLVINCSEMLSVDAMGRFIRGVAQSGSWCGFDEINRIDIGVLSVVASQIASVFSARRDRRSEFVFTDGAMVPLDKDCALFITMNPNYAGRTELPENMKALFRSVAVVVPDMLSIVRVRLSAAGFQDAGELARKLHLLYSMSGELLSSQTQYDFGLRNILSVLRSCGPALRNATSSTPDEAKVLVTVMLSMNLSKLLDKDATLLLDLTRDIFGPVVNVLKAGGASANGGGGMAAIALAATAPSDDPRSQSLIQNIRAEAQRMSWLLPPIFLHKVTLLVDQWRARHGLCVMGPALAGKSAIVALAYAGLHGSRSSAADQPGRRAVTATSTSTPLVAMSQFRCNPKSLTAAELFGSFDAKTGDWTDGVFVTLWRKATRAAANASAASHGNSGDNGPSGQWLVMDGPIDSIWIENLNSVLDDTRMLTLANGDRLTLPSTMKLIFEVDQLAQASPATVSRLGLVYVSADALSWPPIVESWANRMKQSVATFLAQSPGAGGSSPRTAHSSSSFGSSGGAASSALARLANDAKEGIDGIAAMLLDYLGPLCAKVEGIVNQSASSEAGTTQPSTVTNRAAKRPVNAAGTASGGNSLGVPESSLGSFVANNCTMILTALLTSPSSAQAVMAAIGDALAAARVATAALLVAVAAYLPSDDHRRLMHAEVLALASRGVRGSASNSSDASGSARATPSPGTNSLSARPDASLSISLDAGSALLLPPVFYASSGAVKATSNGPFTVFDFFVDTTEGSQCAWTSWSQGSERDVTLHLPATWCGNNKGEKGRRLQPMRGGSSGASMVRTSLQAAGGASPASLPPILALSNGFVLTPHFSRLTQLLRLFLSASLPVLVVGAAGTGKSKVVTHCLASSFDAKTVLTKQLTFSYATTPRSFVSVLFGALEKTTTNAYGPGTSRQRAIVYIDDLHLPASNVWGDQPTNEAVRQLMEDRGSFVPKSQLGSGSGKGTSSQANGKGNSSANLAMDWVPVAATCLVATMKTAVSVATGGGGGDGIPSRLKRHFAIVDATMPPADSIEAILSAQVKNLLSPANGFSGALASDELATSMAKASVAVFNFVAATFKPTPVEFHYIFTLKDLSRLFAGLCLAANPTRLASVAHVAALLTHELLRTFGDRLVTDAAVLQLSRHIVATVDAALKPPSTWTTLVNADPVASSESTGQRGAALGKPWTAVDLIVGGADDRGDDDEASADGGAPESPEERLAAMRRLFGAAALEGTAVVTTRTGVRFSAGQATTVSDSRYRVYQPISDVAEAAKAMQSRLTGLAEGPTNAISSAASEVSSLVWSDFFTRHLLRVARALDAYRGHVLMIGVGGSGKQSLAKCAACLLGHRLVKLRSSVSMPSALPAGPAAASGTADDSNAE